MGNLSLTQIYVQHVEGTQTDNSDYHPGTTMKRLLIIVCILSIGIPACAPQSAEYHATSEASTAAKASTSNSETTLVVERIDTFLEQVPETQVPALYQVRDTDIRIPALTERTMPTAESPQSSDSRGVGLNFENADIHDVAKVVSEITGKTLIVEDGIQGNVTIYSENSLSPGQVFELFKSVLELNDLAITQVGDFYKIIRSEKARERYLAVDSRLGSVTDDLVTQIVKLRYVKGKDVKAALESLTGSEIVLYPDDDGNTLIITDLASNVRKLQEIIAEMDVSQYADHYYVQIFPIEHADLSELILDLNQILALPGAAGALDQTTPVEQQQTPETQGQAADSGETSPIQSLVPPGTATRLYAIERLNALMVSSNNPDVINLVQKWIRILDKPPAGTAMSEGEETDTDRKNYVYPVRYSKAGELATILLEVYGDVGQPTQQAQEGQAPDAQTTGIDEQPPVFIEDASTNSLIIRATQQQYAQILSLLDKLDQRPSQVLIDVIIAEVSLSDNDIFGVQGMLQGQDQLTVSGETNVFTGAIETAFDGISGDTGFSYMLNAPGRFLLQLKALASEGRVKVLSDPHILVQNNQTANINIGDNIPITTTTGTGDTATTSVEYKSTGIILEVTPQINLEGDVVMDIKQEVSSPGTRESGAVAPPINETRATTRLITQDGQPLVIGGLISSKASTSKQGVPLLQEIPLLGRLFRYNETQNTRKELVILVLPRIIRTPEQGWNVTDDALQKRVQQLEDLFNREKTDTDRVKEFFQRQFSPEE